MKRKLATLFVLFCSAFVALGFASCQIIQWQPGSDIIGQYNRYTLELDTSEYDPIVPYGGTFDYQSVKIVYKTYMGENEEAFYSTKTSLTASMVTGGLDTSSVGEKELTIEYGGESFTLPYTVKYQVDFLSKGEVFNTQFVLSADEVVVPEAKAQEGFTFAYWKSEAPEVLTGNISIEAHYYNDALFAPALESFDCIYDPDATIALLTLPSNENGTWEFVDPTTPVGDVGDHKFEVRFVSKTDEIAPVQNEFVQVQVAQKILSTPLVNASLIYNAEVQKATTDVETGILPYEIVNNGGVDVGKYVVTATLKDVKNYAWKEGDGWTKADETGNITFEYVISPKQVEFVILSETFTYNREEQFPAYQFKDSFDNAHITAEDVTVTGTPQRNVDTYEYGFAMSNPNYVGSYKGSFTIEQKELTFIVESESFVYDGTERYPVYSFADPKDTPNVRVMSGKAQTEVGTYKYGWLIMDDNYTGMYTGTFSITKPDVTVTAVLEKTEIVYPASLPEITFEVEGFAGDEALLNITYEKPSLSVGTYEITPVVDNANVNATCVSATLTIEKGEATFYRPTLSTDGLTGTAAVYGEKISTVTFSDEGFGSWAWENPDLIIDSMENFSAIAVFTPQNPNLNPLKEEFFITNEYRQISKRNLEIVVTKNEYMYTGTEVALEYRLVDTLRPESYDIDLSKLTVNGNGEEKSAGEYSKMLEIVSDYYKGVANCKLIIHKADVVVTLTSDEATLKFAPDLTLANSGITPDGSALRVGDNESVSGTYAWEKPTFELYKLTIGEMTSVKVVFTPDDMDNYNVGSAYFNFTIIKADTTIQKSEDGNKLDLAETYTKVFDNQKYTFTATVNRAVVGDYTTFTYVYKDSNGQVVDEVIDAGRYTLTIVAAETPHYNGAEATVNIVVTQASNQWGTATQKQDPYILSTSWTYTENAAKIEADAVWGISTRTIEYENTTTGTIYQNQLPTDAQAGNYTATLCIPETSNWAGLTATVNFTIRKGSVNIPTVAFENGGNKVAYNGNKQIPTVNGTYTNGAINGVNYTVAYPENSTNKGTYYVTLTLEDDVNYVWSGSDSAEVTVGYEITTAANEITSLTMQGWSYKGYDAKDNTPSITAKFGAGNVTYTYYTDEQCRKEISLDNLKNADVGTYYVKASIAAAENGNYTQAEKVSSFTITEGSLTGDFTKTYEITWKKGLTLKDVQLDANYTWDEPDTALIAGSTKSYPATYKIENYEAVHGNLQVVVRKISGTVTAQEKTFTYSEHAFTLDENGANSDLNRLFSVSTNHGNDANEISYEISYKASESTAAKSVTKIADAGVYTVTVKLAESEHYTSATTTVTLTIEKKQNDQNILPMTATYGDNLSLAKDENGKTLSDYDDDYGTWSWNASGTVGDAGTHTYTAVYKPKAEYAVNYAGRTVEVEITVAPKAVTLPTLTPSFVYNGEVQKPDVETSTYYTSAYASENSTNVGSYTVMLTLTSANYEWSGSGATVNGPDATYSYEITKATLTVTADKAQTATYGDKVTTLTLPTSTFNWKNVGTWSWNVVEGATVGNVGEHTFTATCTLSGDDANNFHSVDSVTVTVTVNKASASLTVTGDHTKVYDGKAFAFAGGDITPSHNETATISYSYQVGETVYNELPTDAGTYLVTVTLGESENYLGTSATVTVVINKAEAPTSGTISAKVGDTLSELPIPTSDYGTWKWKEDQTFTTEGDYYVDATFTPSEKYANNYKEYTTKLHISVGQTVVKTTFEVGSYVYTGEDITISVSVKDKEIFLTEYSVMCNGAAVSGHSITVMDAGTYTFKLAFTGSIKYSWNLEDGTIENGVLTKTITIAKADNSWTTTPSIGEKTTFTYGTDYTATAAAKFGTVTTTYYQGNTKLEGKPTNAGVYTVKFAVAGTDNYTGLTQEISYTINPATATMSLDETSVTYNGNEHTRKVIVTALGNELTSNDYTVSGITTATNAGSYEVKVTLTNSNYVFVNGEKTANETTATWTIAKAEVAAVTLTSNTFTYTGKPAALSYTVQTSDGKITLEKGTDYTTNEVATNVKNYTLTITLSDNFMFVAGESTQELTYTITQASMDVELTLSDYNWTYGAFNETNNTLSGSVKKDFTDNVTVKYRYSTSADGTSILENFDSTTQKAGTYYVQAYVDGNENYYGAASTWMMFTIAKATVEVPTWAERTFTYNGSKQKPTIAESDLYTITWGDNNSTNVGTYTFTLALNDTANYEWSSAVQDSYTYEIKPATAKWSVGETSFTYDGNLKTVNVIVKALNTTLTSDDYEVSVNTATNAGSYTLNITLGNNYVFADNSREATQAWTIEKATVEVPTWSETTFTYNDNVQKPTIAESDLYTITWGDNNSTNVGTYTFTLALKDTENYEWSSAVQASYTYEITPATATWNVDNTRFTYDGKAKTVNVTVKALNTALTSDTDYKVSGNTATNAGTHTVTVTLNNQNYVFENGEKTATKSWTIEKAIALVSVDDTTLTYNGEVQTRTVTVMALGKKELTSDTDYTVEGNTKTDADNYELTVKLTNSNYVFYGGKTTETKEWKIEKATLHWSDFTFTINNTEVTNNEGYTTTYGTNCSLSISSEYSFATLTPTYTGTTTGGDAYKSEEAPSDAGSYTITFTYDNTNYTIEGEYAIGLTIKKATPTLSVELKNPDGVYYQNQIDTNLGTLVDNFTANGVNNETVHGSWEYSGLTFNGEKSTFTATFTSENLNYNGYSTSVTIKLKGVAYIGDTYYGTIEAALAAATSGKTVYVVPDTSGFVVIKEDCTIASGVTLCLPYDRETYEDTERTGKSASFADVNEDAVINNRMSFVQVVDNVVITNKGHIIIGGQLGRGNEDQRPTGHTVGSYAELNLGANVEIVCEESSTITSYGYVKEATSNNGSKVRYENTSSVTLPFVIYDYRGGSFSSAAVAEDCLPFNIFDFPNIQCEMLFEYGSMLKGIVTVYASSTVYKPDPVSVLGNSNSLFLMASAATVSIKYNSTSPKYTSVDTGESKTKDEINRTTVHINGNVEIDSLTVSLAGVQCETSKYFCPFSYKYKIYIDSGSTSLKYKMKFYAGFELTVAAGASLEIKDKTIFYQNYKDQNSYACGILTPSVCGPAKLINNGTLKISSGFAGNVETTIAGATITTTSEFSASVKSKEVTNAKTGGTSREYVTIIGYALGNIASSENDRSTGLRKFKSGNTYTSQGEWWRGNYDTGTDENVSDNTSSSCVVSGTLITLADGTRKKVEELTGREELLVFDHETGKYTTSTILFIENDGMNEYEILNVEFSDGTKVRIISEHALFDKTLNKYVYINAATLTDYIGHEFIKGDGSTLETVVMTKAYKTIEVTGCYSLVTAYQLNYFIDDMLSIPGGIDGMFNFFDYDENLKYDETAKANDIAEYGLLSYEALADYGITEEMFEVFNGKYLAVAIGKGNLTMEDIIAMAERYGVHFETDSK